MLNPFYIKNTGSEMQIHTTKIFHFTHTIPPSFKKRKQQALVSIWRNWNFHIFVSKTVEHSNFWKQLWSSSQLNRDTVWPSNSISKKKENAPIQKLVHGCSLTAVLIMVKNKNNSNIHHLKKGQIKRGIWSFNAVQLSPFKEWIINTPYNQDEPW